MHLMADRLNLLILCCVVLCRDVMDPTPSDLKYFVRL